MLFPAVIAEWGGVIVVVDLLRLLDVDVGVGVLILNVGFVQVKLQS